MNTLFPFGFPAPTALYLTLYIVTLVIHVAFMNYVLAGTAWLAFSGIFLGSESRPRTDSPISLVLRDWMPFAVSAAITAGVAPLLFVQILYKENFYTANLLLFHRWMAIVPVLIAGFYLTYLYKSKAIAAWPAWTRIVVGLAMFGCFLFAALSWTENHLLALDRIIWPDLYASGSMIYRNYDIFPRLAMWTAGAFPTMATLVGWQLYATARQSKAQSPGTEKGPVLESFDLQSPAVKTLALLGAVGLFFAGVFAVAYYHLLPKPVQDNVIGGLSLPYLLAAAVGALAQFAGWHFIFHRKKLTAGRLTLASTGCAVTLLGMTVIRETIRLSQIYIEKLYPQHAAAAEKGGLFVFLAFFALNAVLITWCLKLVRRVHPASSKAAR